MNNENDEFWSLELDKRNKQDMQDWIDNYVLVGLVEEESGGIIGYLHRYNERIITILNLWWNEHKPKVGDKIYVGNLGDAVVTDDCHAGIEVYMVKEEDDTISWQLIPDEHSDIVLKSIRVIPVDETFVN